MTPARVPAELDLAEALGPGEGTHLRSLRDASQLWPLAYSWVSPKQEGLRTLYPRQPREWGWLCPLHRGENRAWWRRQREAGLPSPPPSPPPHLHLHHGWPLGPQHLHCLEDVHHTLVPHPLQHDAERDEDARPAHASTVRASAQVSSGGGRVGEPGSAAQFPSCLL